VVVELTAVKFCKVEDAFARKPLEEVSTPLASILKAKAVEVAKVVGLPVAMNSKPPAFRIVQ
jgi:hypothetical protein